MLSHPDPPPPEQQHLQQQEQVFVKGCNRNQGWEPLKYPVAALIDQQPYENEDDGESVAAIPSSTFPLHTDVILAAIRELLILDGGLDAKTLTVNDTTLVRTIMGMPLNEEQQQQQQLGNHDNIVENNSKKRKRDLAVVSPFEATKLEGSSVFIQDTVTGEDVAYAVLFQVIAAGCCYISDKKGTDDVKANNLVEARVTEDSTASTEEMKDDLFEWTLYTTAEEQPISKMRQLLEKMIQDSTSIGVENGMVHLSVLDEAVFRKGAVQMAKALTASFSDHSISLFLGYKGSKNLRQREEAMVGRVLFDTSHAMFAFEHSQEGKLANESGSVDVSTKHVDQHHEVAKVVLESLLEEDRSIQKVGGLGDESLLLHAISIAHDCRNNDSWSHFATTNLGQKNLLHHESTKALLMAGSKRRGKRSHFPRSPGVTKDDDNDDHDVDDDCCLY